MLTALLFPIASLGGLAPTYADAPDVSPPSGPDLLAGVQPTIEAMTVEHFPAPPAAERAGGFRAFPVPTSSAGLRRITTAPNGDMWFVEERTNKIGRITTAGVITEFNLPLMPGDGWVIDLDVDRSGDVWVIWDQGQQIGTFTPSATPSMTAWDWGSPYGEEIRVGPDAVWATMSFDVDGIARFGDDEQTWHENAPECDGALGAGRDGAMWCQQFDRLIRVNADGSGGVTHPLPGLAIYPHSVATGPNHRIWFGRDDGGSMFAWPGDGDIGWITSTNQVRTTNLGEEVAPRSLVTGRDGNVWFASIGGAKGIGHVTKDGKRGAIVKVGNYEPTSVTYGRDGNIWFTDSSNNTIVRVSRDRLWTTNVDVGDGSQLKPRAQPKVKVKGKVNANKLRTKATMKLACATGSSATIACQGKIVVKAGKKTVAKGSYFVAKGSKAKATVKLTRKARKLLKKKSAVAVHVVLKPTSGGKVKSKTKLKR